MLILSRSRRGHVFLAASLLLMLAPGVLNPIQARAGTCDGYGDQTAAKYALASANYGLVTFSLLRWNIVLAAGVNFDDSTPWGIDYVVNQSYTYTSNSIQQAVWFYDPEGSSSVRRGGTFYATYCNPP